MNEDYIKELEKQIDHLQSKLAHAEPTVPYWYTYTANKLHHIYMSDIIVYASVSVERKKNTFKVNWNSWNESKGKLLIEVTTTDDPVLALQKVKEQVEAMIHYSHHIVKLADPRMPDPMATI